MPNMSFLPEDYLEKRIQRRTNTISLVLFVIVMAGVIGAFFVTDRQRTEIRQLQEQVNIKYKQAAERLEQLDELEDRKQEMIRKAKVTASLLERLPKSLVLAQLINNMPSTLSLLEMEAETKVIKRRPTARTSLQKAKKTRKKSGASAAKKKPKTPEVKPTEVSMRLVGVAPTDVQVAQFMTSLSRTDLFTNVNLLFSKEVKIDDHRMRQFRIEMVLESNVDARGLEPKMVRRALNQDPMGTTIQIDAQGQLVIPTDPTFDDPAVVQANDPENFPAPPSDPAVSQD